VKQKFCLGGETKPVHMMHGDKQSDLDPFFHVSSTCFWAHNWRSSCLRENLASWIESQTVKISECGGDISLYNGIHVV